MVAIAYGIASAMAIISFDANARDRLQTVLETSLQSRAQELDSYARSVESDLIIVGATSLVQEAVGDCSRAFHALGPDPTAELQRIYISNNPHGPGRNQFAVSSNAVSLAAY